MLEYKMGNRVPAWSGTGESIKYITFCVTEDCNLACKYCYMLHKNSSSKLTITDAKNAVDYILSNRGIFTEDSIVWDFIGGEPFIEIDMIDELCDYIKLQMYKLSHPWFKSYRFSFSTNGMNYLSDEVQRFIMKNKQHLSIGISVDGNKIKHDLQRVKRDGTGSYDEVIKAVPKWLEQFPGFSTKATFSSDDLAHLRDSIVSIWDLGINDVSANLVFENVWKLGDEDIFEEQLMSLADYVVENNLWWDKSARFFDPSIGYKLNDVDRKDNFCGAANMLSIDTKGDFYPCIRFLDFTMEKATGYKIGSPIDGIDFSRLKKLQEVNIGSVSSQECLECDVAVGCPYCTGFNYDDCNGESLFTRSTYHCKLHKANVRANKYFWKKLEIEKGVLNPRRKFIQKYSEKSFISINGTLKASICNYDRTNHKNNTMTDQIYGDAIEKSAIWNSTLINLGESPNNHRYEQTYRDLKRDEISDMDCCVLENSIVLNLKASNIGSLADTFTKFVKLDEFERYNFVYVDLEDWEVADFESYRSQLSQIATEVQMHYANGKHLEVNALTDYFVSKDSSICKCGVDFVAIAPDSKVYLCPAYYYDSKFDSICSLENMNFHEESLQGIQVDECDSCEIVNCRRCKYLLEKASPKEKNLQCKISNVEYQVASIFNQQLNNVYQRK